MTNLGIQSADVQFCIRPYQAGDFDRLWEIDQMCFPPGIAYSQMELTGFIMRRNAITLVAELESNPERRQPSPVPPKSDSSPDGKAGSPAPPPDPARIAGYIIAQPLRKTGRILTLDILPEARQCGLATRLMLEVEERLRRLGCHDIYLETAVNNEAALRLYHKLGYTILRTLPEYYHAQGLDAFLLGKRL